MYDVYLWLSGKRVVDFLLVLIKLFSLGVTTAESLWGENRSKIGVLKAGGSVCAKCSRRRECLSPIILQMNAVQLCRW